MKLILVASMALAAYLVSSAERTSMTIMRSAVAGERLVQGLHQVGGAVAVRAHDHPVRFHEIGDRGALLQKFRVGDGVVFDGRPASLERLRHGRPHLVRRTTGTVDLVMTTLYSVMCSPMVRATAST